MNQVSTVRVACTPAYLDKLTVFTHVTQSQTNKQKPTVTTIVSVRNQHVPVPRDITHNPIAQTLPLRVWHTAVPTVIRCTAVNMESVGAMVVTLTVTVRRAGLAQIVT